MATIQRYYHVTWYVPITLARAMSTNPPSELKLRFEAGLNEFDNRTGTNLVQHQTIDKLVNCQSADSVIERSSRASARRCFHPSVVIPVEQKRH